MQENERWQGKIKKWRNAERNKVLPMNLWEVPYKDKKTPMQR